MFEYENNTEDALGDNEDQPLDQITWSAKEYQDQNKSFSWYATLYLVGSVIVLASIFFYYKKPLQMLSVILVVSSIVASLHIISRKKPKTINYSIDEDILIIDGKAHSLGSFRSFSVVNHANQEEIKLIPTSTTQPGINVRLDEENKAKVFELLSNNIPYEYVKPSLIDKIADKLGI